MFGNIFGQSKPAPRTGPSSPAVDVMDLFGPKPAADVEMADHLVAAEPGAAEPDAPGAERAIAALPVELVASDPQAEPEPVAAPAMDPAPMEHDRVAVAAEPVPPEPQATPEPAAPMPEAPGTSAEAAPAEPDVVALLGALTTLGTSAEFSLLRQGFDVAPDGLFDFTVVNPTALTALLQSRFQGVGASENLCARVSRGVYYMLDTRHDLGWETEIAVADMEPDAAIAQEAPG